MISLSKARISVFLHVVYDFQNPDKIHQDAGKSRWQLVPVGVIQKPLTNYNNEVSQMYFTTTKMFLCTQARTNTLANTTLSVSKILVANSNF